MRRKAERVVLVRLQRPSISPMLGRLDFFHIMVSKSLEDEFKMIYSIVWSSTLCTDQRRWKMKAESGMIQLLALVSFSVIHKDKKFY